MKELVRLFFMTIVLTIPVMLLLKAYIDISLLGMLCFSLFLGVFSVLHALVQESKNINTVNEQ